MEFSYLVSMISKQILLNENGVLHLNPYFYLSHSVLDEIQFAISYFFRLDEFELHSPTGPNNGGLIGRIIEKS